uniref:Si:ch211-272n13.3 n=1 Tax=Cyprinodon variegatus TaxID=28743 RepID=A0A3Q2DBX0_CYPVA
MKKLFGFTKKKKNSSGTSDNVSALSDGYDLKDKDLGKIHKAALQADLAKLKQLLKKNDVNQVDKESRTALHVACATGHAEVVQLLVDSKAKLDLRDNQHRSALMKAVQGQHEGCLTILLENGASPNLEDINGNTALHLAANIPSLSMAGLLLHHGAEINAQNKEGFTPLTVAVREDRLEMAEFLLKETADVNSLDREHRSPLMLAAGGGQHRMVKLLLQFQPDVTIQDDKGWSADDYAVRNGHHSCCLLITEHGTKQTPRASVSHPGPSKKKNILAFPSQDVDTSFSLGGPATNKDLEDDSLSESVSRASKSANDEWPSTEDEDDSAEKKPSKISQIFGSKMGKAPVLPEMSRSDTESEEESETGVQRIPASPQHPVDLPAVSSLLPKSPWMASTPLPSARKVHLFVKKLFL